MLNANLAVKNAKNTVKTPRRFLAVLAVLMVPGALARRITIPDEYELLEQIVVENEIALVVLDPINSFLSAKIDAHRDAEIRRVLDPLAALCARRHFAALAVVHLNRRTDTDVLNRITGSGGYGGSARSILTFGKHPEDDTQRVVAAEGNWQRENRSELFELREVIVFPDAAPEDQTQPALVHVGTVDLDSSDLVDQLDDDRPALEQAKEFLLGELALGPVPVSDLTPRRRGERDLLAYRRARQEAARRRGATDLVGDLAARRGPLGVVPRARRGAEPMSQTREWLRFVEKRRRELHDAYPCARRPTGAAARSHRQRVGPVTRICKPCRDELYEQLADEYLQAKGDLHAREHVAWAGRGAAGLQGAEAQAGRGRPAAAETASGAEGEAASRPAQPGRRDHHSRKETHHDRYRQHRDHRGRARAIRAVPAAPGSCSAPTTQTRDRQRAAEIANALARVIREKQAVRAHRRQGIRDSSRAGRCSARCWASSRSASGRGRLEDGWEARVEVRRVSDGRPLGAAEADACAPSGSGRRPTTTRSGAWRRRGRRRRRSG